MTTSLQETLLLEADELLSGVYNNYSSVTESILGSYGIKEDEVTKDPQKSVAAINRAKIKRDIKAIIRIIEIAILAVIAYKISSYILAIIFTAGVAAIIWVLYRLSTNVVAPAIAGTRQFFTRYITISEAKIINEKDPKKVKQLKDVKKQLTDGIIKLDNVSKELETNK